ncbi:MAG: NUDIX hydrolase [Leptolyngbya sp. SIO4C1]|nr:NUDIX hydrolase [Leptolyngbya sp. SIO4C1]
MKFKNRPNRCFNIDGEELWISRSVTVLPVLLFVQQGGIFVPLNKRGQALPDEVGKWGLPGGYLDYDETAGEAVVREVWEELGLDILTLQLEHTLKGSLEQPTYVFSQPRHRQNVTLRFSLLFFLKSGTELPVLDPQVGTDEVEDAQWFDLEAALGMSLSFRHEQVIRDCLETDFKESLQAVR